MAGTARKSSFILKLTAALTVLLVLFALLFPQPAAAAADYSSIRVKLNISGTDLNVKVTGSYQIKEDPALSLKSGSAYTISVSDKNIRIQGPDTDKTLPSVTFLRGSNEASSGHLLTIGSYSYLGNICFTSVSNKVQAINTLDLEHYLYGVVAREMGESFPQEALNAQAICARGYAIRKIDAASSSSSYDIIGASSDQAYIGFNANYKKTIQAVNSTKGQVLTYNGEIIEAFFTASNGGQTECTGSTWGGGAGKDARYPYLIQQDDPYDLASCAGNNSYENTFFVPADPAGSADANNVYTNPVLNDLQNLAFAALMEKHGLTSASEVTLTKINSITNGQKRWPDYENSRSYVDAVANITVTLPNEVSETLDVTLILMNKSGSSYSLSHDYLNGSFRLRSAEPTENGWNIVARRYGHGVGMSQMGAKNMASAHNMNYNQILGFYYPGTTLTTLSTGDWDSGSTPPNTLTVNGEFVTGIAPETEVKTFLSSSGKGYTLYDAAGTAKTAGIILTGDLLKDAAGNVYHVVIFGDLNSDGLIALADLLRQQKHLLGTITLNGAPLRAADVTKDNHVDIADLLRIQKHLLGAATITQ